MPCWNGLSAEQQDRLLTIGNLPITDNLSVNLGECPNGAELEITTMYDVAPGPRFYCRSCAARYVLDELPPPSAISADLATQEIPVLDREDRQVLDQHG
jgi:hypothetical protein